MMLSRASSKIKAMTNELPFGRAYVDPCPIHTLDEAVLWMATNGGKIVFNPAEDKRAGFIGVECAGRNVIRSVGNGFDARGTLMMATRDLWMLLHGEAKQ